MRSNKTDSASNPHSQTVEVLDTKYRGCFFGIGMAHRPSKTHRASSSPQPSCRGIQTSHSNKNSGFIKLILLIVVVILLLSYFGVSLRNIANSETGKDNFGFVKEIGTKIWDVCLSIWNQYLEEKVMFVWNDIIIKYGWNFVTDLVDKFKK